MKTHVIIFLMTFVFFKSNGQMCGIVDSSNSSQWHIRNKLDLNNLYFNNSSCTFLIHPPCADSIYLNFVEFRSEYLHDSISIFDGTSINDPLLLTHSGLTIPPSVVATSGSMFLVWNSDSVIADSGFVATWNSKNNNLNSCNCYPTGLINCCGISISRVKINQITSPINSLDISSGVEYYSDKTCENSITFFPNSDYLFNIYTTLYNQQLKTWIDFDNNGSFDPVNEMILDSNFTDSISFIKNFDSLSIPFNGQTVRMRISTDMPGIGGPCSNVLFGEVEDYSVSFSLIIPSNIDEIESNHLLHIYQNPVSDNLYFELNSAHTNLKVNIYNSLGLLVSGNNFYKTDSDSKFNLDVSAFPDGIYHLVVYDADKREEVKFVKMQR